MELHGGNVLRRFMNTSKKYDISIITVTYNSREVIKKFLKEVKKIKNAEIIVVDNGSKDGTEEILKREKKIRKIFLKRNYGYARANNIGFKKSKGDIILLLNPDAYPLKIDLKNIKDLIKEYQIVAPLLLRDEKEPEDSIREFPSLKGFIFPFLWKKKFDYSKEQIVPQPMFSAIFIKRDLFEKLNGFDERFFLYFTDVEFMQRVKNKGIYAFFTPEIIFFHQRGKGVFKNKKILSKKYLDWGRGASKYFWLYKNLFEKILSFPLIWIYTLIRYFFISVL